MNARLKVEELPRQVLHARLPGLPEVVGQEADQHGPHPEVQIARLRHAAHAGVDEGKPRASLRPGRDFFGIDGFVEQIVTPVDVVELHPVLHLELLDEVAMPA